MLPDVGPDVADELADGVVQRDDPRAVDAQMVPPQIDAELPSGVPPSSREHTLTIGAHKVIAADPAVVRLYALVQQLAVARIPVLVGGETGTGKELVASALHAFSQRASRPMVSINCAALHESLVDSELFGHERGSFSGAVATRRGVIESASGSTLFLDEVGELSLDAQAKLLRVLETYRVARIGDHREHEVDVRIVAATNRELVAEVEAGRFRQDLYFRLAAARLNVPPLRARPEELPLLANAFLVEACAAAGRKRITISEHAVSALRAHAWPGNVRELKNFMQYVAATLSDDILFALDVEGLLNESMPATAVTTATAITTATSPPRGRTFRPLADELRELELTRLREALEETRGNQTKAAGLLGMPVRTFFEKVKVYRLDPKKERVASRAAKRLARGLSRT